MHLSANVSDEKNKQNEVVWVHCGVNRLSMQRQIEFCFINVSSLLQVQSYSQASGCPQVQRRTQCVSTSGGDLVALCDSGDS